jgi:hypothetical protein
MFEGFLFRQRNDEQPAGAKQRVASCSTLDCGDFFFQRNNELPASALALKDYLRSSRQRSILVAPSTFEKEGHIVFLEPSNNRCTVYWLSYTANP